MNDLAVSPSGGGDFEFRGALAGGVGARSFILNIRSVCHQMSWVRWEEEIISREPKKGSCLLESFYKPIKIFLYSPISVSENF